MANGLYFLLKKTKVGKIYTPASLYIFILDLILFATKEIKNSFFHFLRRIGIKKQYDIIFTLNYIELPEPKKLLDLNIESISFKSLFNMFKTSWSAAMLLTKNSMGQYDFNMVGKSLSPEFREQYAQVFNYFLQQLAENENLQTDEILKNTIPNSISDK